MYPGKPRWLHAGRAARFRSTGTAVRWTGVTAAAATAVAAIAGLAGPAAAAAASPANGPAVAALYAAPQGGAAGKAPDGHPLLSIGQAQQAASRQSANGDVVVYLTGGTYRLPSPLQFTAADSGQNGHTITFEALPGQHPVLDGARRVRDWTLQDQAKNIWLAHVGTGANTRQLYVNGTEAPRAAVEVPRSDFTFTPTGMTFNDPSLGYLSSLPDQNQIDVESLDSFTDRYSPVQSISGNSIVMQQPAWDNNTWGYDTLSQPFAGGTMYLENSYAFLQRPGQWSVDSATGDLYYKAAPGQDMHGLDVELPTLSSLVDISGSYSDPAQGLAFRGIQFSGTSWLGPSTNQGYADQQNGTFITGSWPMPANWLSSCQSGCQQFEALRQHWGQIPAAVQVSAASHIAFSDDVFAELGQVGLGIGNDADANASGTGLGASDITVTGSTFTGDAATGIVAGGVQADAHHPSDPRMTNSGIQLSDNLVTGTGTDYRETSAILSTYVTGANITHNQVDHLPYDGIDIGWGWGMNDPGGSQDYAQRGTYNYQPIYTTPTTEKDNLVAGNLIFDTKNAMHDGGSIYNLSANPGTVIQNNYMYNNNHTVALYMDEGSRYVTLSDNVVQDAGVWALTNASSLNNTDDNTFDHNWYNSGATYVATGPPHNNVLTGNVAVNGYNWPSDAESVIKAAGLEPGHQAPTPVGQDVALSAPSVVRAGAAVPVKATVSNNSSETLQDTTLKLSAPSGWSVQPTSATLGTVAANGTGSATFTVTPPPGVAPGSYQLTGDAAFSEQASGPGSATGTATVTVPYSSLAAAYNDRGTSDDTSTAAGNLDGAGYSLSAQALAAAGVTPGSAVTAGGLSFTWPSAAAGTPDNVDAGGQAILVNGTGSTLGFLLTGTFGPASGTGTIYYTDGSSQPFTVTAPDWYNLPSGTSAAITMAYRNAPGNAQDHHPVYVYYAGVPLTAGKTVQAVQLPDISGSPPPVGAPAMHIFAMSIG